MPVGGTTRITVRSTFVSGVGVFLTVGAIVFLAHLVGLGHPPATQASGRRTTHPSFPDRDALRATRVNE